MATNQSRKDRLQSTTAANVFRDEQGKIITDHAVIVASYAELVPIPATMDAGQVIAILNSVKGDDADDATMMARIDAIKSADPVSKEKALAGVAPIPTKHDRSGNEVAPLSAIPFYRAEAFKLGAMLDDTKFAEHMRMAAQAKEELEGSALYITGDLEEIFGEKRNDKGEVIRENLVLNWPVPGTGSRKWRDSNPGYNGPTDKYSVTDKVSGGKIEGYFTVDIWESSKEGKAICSNIAALKEMKENKGALSASTPKAFHYLEGDVKRIDGVLKRWNNRRTTPLSRFRKAIGFIQAKAKMREFPMIDMDYVELNKDGTPNIPANAQLNAPIVLCQPNHKSKVSDTLSLSQFIGLKWDELAKLPADEQTFPRLITLSRRTPRPKGTTVTAKPDTDIRVKSVPTFDAAMSEINNYLTDDGAKGSLYSILNGNSDTKWSILENVALLKTALIDLDDKYGPQLEQHLTEIARAKTAEAKAKLKAA